MFLQVKANTQKNRQVAEVNRDWSQRPEDLMLLGKKFLRSPSYKLYVEKWQHREPILEYDRTFVCDFLMAILLVTGGEHKGDVIRNMTVEEFHNMTFRTREDGKEVTYLINMYDIK